MMRNRRYAILLLTALLPMLLLSSLHRHPSVVPLSDTCDRCAHHVEHGGHWGTARADTDNCALCSFMALVYLISQPERMLSAWGRLWLKPQRPPQRIAFSLSGPRSRAPPLLLLAA